VSSWRDSVSQGCQDDLDALLASALPAAREFLAKSGEFYPFGFSMASTGETGMIAAYEGAEHPTSSELLTMLYDGLRGQSKSLRGAAVVADVRIKHPDSDAIRVELEHREGVAMVLFLPYRVEKKRNGREVAYGEMRLEDSDRRIWPASP
jgi:hypothetical protein